MTFTEPILVQLHWQDRANPDRTEFVAQGEFSDQASFEAWVLELLGRRGSEMPEGWSPMVCTADAPCFVMAANPQPEAA